MISKQKVGRKPKQHVITSNNYPSKNADDNPTVGVDNNPKWDLDCSPKLGRDNYQQLKAGCQQKGWDRMRDQGWLKNCRVPIVEFPLANRTRDVSHFPWKGGVY